MNGEGEMLGVPVIESRAVPVGQFVISTDGVSGVAFALHPLDVLALRHPNALEHLRASGEWFRAELERRFAALAASIAGAK